MKYVIQPLISVGDFILNEQRSHIRKNVEAQLRDSYEKKDRNNTYLIDDYDGILAYYNLSNKKLFYVMFVPLPSIDLRFDDFSLFNLSSNELYELLNKYDDSLYKEDYVGFGSTKLGIDIYAPNYTEDETCKCEAVSIAIKGYFDSLYHDIPLDIDALQGE